MSEAVSPTGLVALEGLHALKHAYRFGASVEEIWTDDLDKALELSDAVAPDLRAVLEERATVVPTAQLREHSAQPIPTRVLAYARPRTWIVDQALPTVGQDTILLDDPRNSKNLGAVVRVAAAVGAAGVLAQGAVSFFDPMAVRGAAGLQWALPCCASAKLCRQLDELRPASDFALVGLDASGAVFDPTDFPGPTIFAFGSERTGLSTAVRERCDAIVSLPMTPQVSSLNLATCVSAVMYLRQYARGDHARPSVGDQ
ncbi:MAG: TrmH family RNA methyltransferase [Propionibacteriaceae bacterium]|nr:TrmH family RNA methyltransferase [Propionibacteriaceae bacterium]